MAPTDTQLAPLASPSDLVGLRGGPFSQQAVEAAGDAIRFECRWHIAPVAESTCVVRTGGSATAWLPTLHLVEVTSVRDVRTGEELAAPWWVVPGSGLERPSAWPDLIEVTMRHGYDNVPKALLPVIAQRALDTASGRIRSESLGGRAVSLESGTDPAHATVLSALTIPGRP